MSCFHEEQVEAMMQCPLLEISGRNTDPLPSARKLLRWAVLEAFEGRLPTIQGLRNKFEWFWINHSNKNGIKGEHFYAGMRAGNTAARKVFLLLQDYKVVKPGSYYMLHLADHTIDGYYAVLQSVADRTVQAPVVLVERRARPRYYQMPGVVQMLRFYHLMTTSSFGKLGIVNLPLLKGNPWTRKTVDVALVQKSLVSILGMLKTSHHPAPGPHCEHCATKRCLEVFSE